MHAHTPMHTAEIWKKNIILIFLISWKHFYNWIGINILHYSGVFVLGFSLSFYWLSGVKWIRMWSHRPWLRLLTKPTLILSRSICQGSHNFVDLSCVNNTQLSVASAIWRDCKLLYEGPWQTRDWALINSAHEHKCVIDIDGIITEFARLKGTHPAHFLSPPWWRHWFTLFCCKHCILPITLEMGKINNESLHFYSSWFT